METPTVSPEAELSGDVECKPQIGMLFNTELEAYNFYNKYGGSLGFSIRRDYANKSRKDKTTITSRRFVCCKSGFRKEYKRDVYTSKPRAKTRTECPARMSIYLSENGKYECRDFVEEHNHILDLVDESRIKPKSIFEYMGRQAGGRENLGYTSQDHKNYLRTKKQRSLSYGEAGSLLRYFENQCRINPFFTYSMQLDSDEQITNIFWADPKMIIDYAQFGDVVSFDTTFCTNKEYRPFGIFVGFNHHRGAIIFGAALLYDETVESFKWLFEAFAEAHGQKKPITIFTDQDAAMAKALNEVWPETWHGLCTWHIVQNCIKHLGDLMKEDSHFLRDLKKCIFQYEEEIQFEDGWQILLRNYGIENNSWLQCIYELKYKWAKCYMKNTFTLGMQSTQFSESLNSDMKDYLKSTLDIVQFFKHFERVVDAKRTNELKVEFDSRNKLPRIVNVMSPVIKQAGEVYTPLIFELFQEQMDWVSICLIKNKNESNPMCEYLVGLMESECEYKVCCNPSELMINCSCKKYETFGILCCHSLKVLDVLDIKCIPSAYILKRWTRGARNMVVIDNKGKQVEEDVNLDSSQRYRRLCPELVKIASQASNSAEGYALVMKAAKELRVQLDSITASDGSQVAVPNGRQKKSKIEKQRNKKRRTETRNSQNSQEIHSTPAPTSGAFSMSNVPDYLQQMDDNISFTSLSTGGTSVYDLSLAVSSQASTKLSLQNFQEQD
ncbi:protein FAR1-RELATED SEQUENCE 5-like [Telopea speciosissima]|uniref:protein FAR1-RELATED SEQUENCE 5-like n=1 Tax=Telopea speciosissima TaxID=54955 RepID=UPI001CC477EA|nr:protein FAR1-RELATED SEQUENCE 5-like [Telopea speciosissima]